eukprot:CAMPEP_0117535444 /NCGR_PEP_ID=MMETSP0784-20121206/40938_1 /TAXON_ID=39447 /ORGANISM="" /LENGTH=221 /DNA_ID=CAMNT_0005331971 /DNA_START=30 /DNA_END=696 /DNA_ORIENTATION=-
MHHPIRQEGPPAANAAPAERGPPRGDPRVVRACRPHVAACRRNFEFFPQTTTSLTCTCKSAYRPAASPEPHTAKTAQDKLPQGKPSRYDPQWPQRVAVAKPAATNATSAERVQARAHRASQGATTATMRPTAPQPAAQREHHRSDKKAKGPPTRARAVQRNLGESQHNLEDRADSKSPPAGARRRLGPLCVGKPQRALDVRRSPVILSQDLVFRLHERGRR